MKLSSSQTKKSLNWQTLMDAPNNLKKLEILHDSRSTALFAVCIKLCGSLALPQFMYIPRSSVENLQGLPKCPHSGPSQGLLSAIGGSMSLLAQ